jgi:hypothetical protein
MPAMLVPVFATTVPMPAVVMAMLLYAVLPLVAAVRLIGIGPTPLSGPVVMIVLISAA